MQPWIATMFAVDEAERRGDAAAALLLMNERPLAPDGRPFWRPWRVTRLAQVEFLGPALPGWATSRWIAAQAHDMLGEPGDRRRRRCRELALQVRGGTDGLSIHGELDALCKLTDSDWVYRQLFLYDLGGLADFVRSAATPDLLAGADRIHDWCRAPMTALRLVGRSSRTVTWERLDDGTHLEMPNIGSAALVMPGESVLGRVVPTADGDMLESSPLVVPHRVAQAVVDEPVAWWQPISANREEIETGGFEASILSDVHSRLWPLVLLCPGGHPPESDIHRCLARGVLAVAREVLHEGREWEDEDVDPWACLHAALVDCHVLTALPEVMSEADASVLERLAEGLAAPADSLCRAVVADLRAAA